MTIGFMCTSLSDDVPAWINVERDGCRSQLQDHARRRSTCAVNAMQRSCGLATGLVCTHSAGSVATVLTGKQVAEKWGV